MKAVRFFGPRKVMIEDVDVPKVGPEDALIRVRRTGVCGTDVHIYTHAIWNVKIPITMGHEFVGEIAELGKDVKVFQKYSRIDPELKVGNRVVAEPIIPCQRCYWCLRGMHNLCANMDQPGFWCDGSFAEYVKIPAWRLTNLPDEVSWEDGCLIEPLACALQAVARSRITLDDTVVVLGAGPIGMLVCQAVKLSGAAFVVQTDKSKVRRKIAEQIGAADAVLDPTQTDLKRYIMDITKGIGADVVFEVVGVQSTFQQAIEITRRAGQVIAVGIPTENYNINVNDLVLHALDVHGVMATVWNVGAAINLIQKKKIQIAPLVTHKLPLEKAVEALEMSLKGEESVKILLTP